jgi:hypothetical protein
LSVAGNTDVTLTSVQGAPDQARNQHFVFTGALTGNINVFWPLSRNRFFSVKNGTSGAFTLTIAVVGTPGATVVVPQGETVSLASDGTNITTRFNAFVGGLTIGGGFAALGGGSVDTLTLLTSLVFTRPTVGGTGNAILLTYSPAPASYVNGAKYEFVATAANSGATQVNINGLGLKDLFRRTPTGIAACVGGEIQVGDIVEMEYDGTQLQLISQAANAGSFTGGTLTSTTAMSGAAFNEAQGSNIVAAATTDIGALAGNVGVVTNASGATSITALGTAPAGASRKIHFSISGGSVTLVHSGNIQCPGGINLPISSGDWVEFRSNGSGSWTVAEHMFYNTFASAATTLAGTDALQALTASGFAGNKSIGASGYYKFPGGLIIQWA